MNLQKWVRPNILNLKPYSSARDEFKGEASVYLDANESPYNEPYNRYPDPLQWELKKKISTIKEVSVDSIFLGVGSDECIDVLFRAFCEPVVDNVLSVDPTYGMYKVCADINNVEYRTIPLNSDFDIDTDRLLDKVDNHTKVIFLCSPNNPSGNLLSYDKVEYIINRFDGIVAIDEAYIDFADTAGFLPRLRDFDNLVVMHTFSKAWESAAVRLGMAFANPAIIAIFNKIKYPYNINLLTQQYAMQLLERVDEVRARVAELIKNRNVLQMELVQLPIVCKIYNSDANFLLVKVEDAKNIYNYLVERGVIVRNRHNIALCDNCLRITVGTPDENCILIDALKNYIR